MSTTGGTLRTGRPDDAAGWMRLLRDVLPARDATGLIGALDRPLPRATLARLERDWDGDDGGPVLTPEGPAAG